MLFSLAGGVAAITGGSLALVVEKAASSASDAPLSYSSSALKLEQMLANNVLEQATENKNEWRSMQEALKCCGYTDISSPSKYWDEPFLRIVQHANHASTGKYCSSCTDTSGSSMVCPKAGASWCRPILLEKIELHHKVAGIIGLVIGITQLGHAILSLYTLLYDVRTLRRRSPELEIPRQPLAPVAQVTFYNNRS